jgi:hypothetical protein
MITLTELEIYFNQGIPELVLQPQLLQRITFDFHLGRAAVTKNFGFM